MKVLSALLCSLVIISAYAACDNSLFKTTWATLGASPAVAANSAGWEKCLTTVPTGTSSCCIAADVTAAKLSTKVNAKMDTIETSQKAWDEYFIKTALPAVVAYTKWTTLKTAVTAATDAEVDAAAALASANRDEIKVLTGALRTATTFVAGKTSTDLGKVWTSLTTARKTCITQIAKFMGDNICLACLEAPAPAGVTDAAAVGGVVPRSAIMEDDACTTLQTACYPYVTAAVNAGSILDAYAIAKADLATPIAAFLDKVVANTAADADWTDATNGIKAKVVAAAAVNNAANNKPARLPKGCASAATCTWICSGMFLPAGATWDLTAVSYGGIPQENLFTVDATTWAAPAAGTGWNPAGTESGVTVDYDENPGDLTAPVAGSRILHIGFVVLVSFAMLFI